MARAAQKPIKRSPVKQAKTKRSTEKTAAIRARLEMVQKVAATTGHCVITDAQIREALLWRGRHLDDFCERYGQSLDCVVCGDISGMIASRIVEVGASVWDGPDPIFAAIEAHRKADAAFEKACDNSGEKTPEENAAERAHSLAMRKLCATAPMTMAGLAAFIAYLRPLYEEEVIGFDEFTDGRTNELFETLERPVKKLEAAR